MPRSLSLLGDSGYAGNATSQLWGARPSSMPYGTIQLTPVELLCSRLLGLDLCATGQDLGTTGYAAAQVWYHAEIGDPVTRRPWSTTHGTPPTSSP
jgi:hypothetical protein